MVFSSALHTFTAVCDKSLINVGESANIYIRIYDIHGNPVAAGSKLTASATKGKMSETDLMPAANDYGFGTTYFGTTITNDLKPGQDESTNAVVTIELDSPNGSAKRNISIFLNVN